MFLNKTLSISNTNFACDTYKNIKGKWHFMLKSCKCLHLPEDDSCYWTLSYIPNIQAWGCIFCWHIIKLTWNLEKKTVPVLALLLTNIFWKGGFTLHIAVLILFLFLVLHLFDLGSRWNETNIKKYNFTRVENAWDLSPKDSVLISFDIRVLNQLYSELSKFWIIIHQTNQ